MNQNAWEQVSTWYDKLVSEQGHYYHREVILPKLLKMLGLKEKDKVLDLACGQGVLSRCINPKIHYVGIDKTPAFIKIAKKSNKSSNHHFFLGDASKNLSLEEKKFTHAVLLLAFQNLKNPQKVLHYASNHLSIGSKLFIVLNHPCFRIPKNTHWGFDDVKGIQYRKVENYLTPLEIPIQIEPSKQDRSPIVYTYHYSLSDISRFLFESGFSILLIEEWCSNKKSIGKKAFMENKARTEFPLFLTLVAEKKRHSCAGFSDISDPKR